jgi:hypothetical protein
VNKCGDGVRRIAQEICDDWCEKCAFENLLHHFVLVDCANLCPTGNSNCTSFILVVDHKFY